MTTKILAVAILFAVAFMGCDGMERMMPPDSEVEMPDVIQTSATSEWSHLCEGYDAWLETSSEPPIVATENISDYIDIGGYGTWWTGDNGVNYGFSRSSGVDLVPTDYEIGDWITGLYLNTPQDSDVPIDFVYLCVDSNLVDTGGKHVFKADAKGRVELAFRLLPAIQSMDTVESRILATIVFKDGYVTYDTPAYLFKMSQMPKSWEDVDWEQLR